MKIIADVDNVNYYENRAIEFIREAQHVGTQSEYQELMSKAIFLLALAQIKREF